MNSAQTMVFRGTGANPGRHVSVTPANSATRHLSYGRIILRDGVETVRFSTGGAETGLIVLSGGAEVAVDGKGTALNQTAPNPRLSISRRPTKRYMFRVLLGH